MVLLGPSGCGKTTTLRMIAGLESISSGTLSIDGRIVNGVPAKDRDIAMVFQSYALYPHMSVKENLAFGLRRRAVPRDEIERRVVGVADDARAVGAARPQAACALRRATAACRARARDRARSEGLPVRRAAVQPRCRLAGLDARRDLGAASPARRDHDLRHPRSGRGDDAWGSRICIMNGGKVVQVGEPLEVYRRPANTFVASFLGNPPMNLHEGVGHRRRRADAACGSAPGRSRSAPTACRRCGPARRWSSASGRRRSPACRVRGNANVEVEIVQVEPLGAETIFAARIPGSKSRSLRASVRISRSRSASGASSASILPPRMCSTPTASRSGPEGEQMAEPATRMRR